VAAVKPKTLKATVTVHTPNLHKIPVKNADVANPKILRATVTVHTPSNAFKKTRIRAGFFMS
jgi:hypothetical protein